MIGRRQDQAQPNAFERRTGKPGGVIGATGIGLGRRGVIGVGEPPTISTAAAIGNAVANAIGVRVPEWPMTPRNVLNALATASREGRA